MDKGNPDFLLTKNYSIFVDNLGLFCEAFR
jgi:hypothetical protein